jgi:hypothetical protein
MIFCVCLIFIIQTAGAAQLVIKISSNRDPQEYVYLPELKILKDGKEFRTLHPQSEHKQVLKDLHLGTYTFVYKTIFDKEEQVRIDITEQKKYSVDLYIDYFDYSKETYTPIIDRLKENDSCTIFISSQGCFHFSKDTLVIRRNKDLYTMNWSGKFKILSVADVEKIRHFEMELKHMMDDGCTTTDTYLITYHGEPALFISDGSCNWNGRYYLKKDLFGE